MRLRYRKVGKWNGYLRGETVYAVLSLVANSLLAWQVFAGTLASGGGISPDWTNLDGSSGVGLRQTNPSIRLPRVSRRSSVG